MALLETHQGPWMCIGDFNYVINEEKVLGGRKGCSLATNYLKELMVEFGAIDLGFFRSKFTWAKGRWGNASIKRRLDRGIANMSWRLAYSKASIVHLSAIKSDHAPILLDTNPKSKFAQWLFRFEVTWLRDDQCHEVIESAWKDQVAGSKFIRLYKKQASTRDTLRKWNKKVFGNCQNKINSLLLGIKEIQQGPPIENSGALEDALQSKLSKWLLRSETLWSQKSRELWLKLGDRNTKFFHLSTIFRRKRNNIDAIRDEQGSWFTETESIRSLFLNSFKNLFKQEEVNFPPHLEHLVLRVSPMMKILSLAKSPPLRRLRPHYSTCKISKPQDLMDILSSFTNSYGQLSGMMSSRRLLPFSASGLCPGR